MEVNHMESTNMDSTSPDPLLSMSCEQPQPPNAFMSTSSSSLSISSSGTGPMITTSTSDVMTTPTTTTPVAATATMTGGMAPVVPEVQQSSTAGMITASGNNNNSIHNPAGVFGGRLSRKVHLSPTPSSCSLNNNVNIVATGVTTPTATTSASSASSSSSAKSVSKISEKVGRWSEEEHEIFLRGLEKHGKQWKTIATMIGTRTVVQVRTHAQKYFQKVERHSKNQSSSSTPSSVSQQQQSSSTQPSPPPPTCPPIAVPLVSPTSVVSSASSASLSSSPRMGGGSSKGHRTTGSTVSKRKSLPPCMPSRKKLKSPKKTPTRLSLPMVSSLSTSPLPELPAYDSSSSLGSEAWSTVSPAGVMDTFDLNATYDAAKAVAAVAPAAVPPSQHSGALLMRSDETASVAASTAAALDSSIMPPTSMDFHGDDEDEDDFNGFDIQCFGGEDPLQWLVDGEAVHEYLPESSLPVFPDLASTSTNTHVSSVQPPLGGVAASCLQMDNSNDSTKEERDRDAMIDDAIFQNIADPNLTVQALFMNDDD